MTTEAGRQRNPRGEGSRLRGEIIAAAAQAVDETGSTQDVTLRAIARRVGVTAPAIYSHFDGPDAIVEAVVDLTFADFYDCLRTAADLAASPSDRVRAICTAYLDFAEKQPHRYRLLFQRQTAAPGDTRSRRDLHDPRLGGFKQLVDAVELTATDGSPDAPTPAPDPMITATGIWIGLHGFATLHTSFPRFPWPATEQIIELLVRDHLRLAR